jgi:hypothetical protein
MVGNVWVKGSAALPVCNARVIPGDLLLDGPADSVVVCLFYSRLMSIHPEEVCGL